MTPASAELESQPFASACAAANCAKSRALREIETLPPAQRSVLTQRDVEGWTSEEVCETLGISEMNQRVLLHRARVRVVRDIEPHFSAPALPGG